MSSPVNIINLKGEDLEGVFLDIREVARVFGRELKGEHLLRSLKERLQTLWTKTKSLAKPRKVLIVEWIEPLLSAGHWMPELAEMAGLEMLFAKKGHGSARLSWAQVKDANPDLIVVAPCGFGIDRSLQELTHLRQNSDWVALNAVKKNQVFVADGNQFFNRPGPRLVETAEILAEMAYPEIFQFGHQGNHWRNVDIH
jgi:iron complex transport system substrate-binding protein